MAPVPRFCDHPDGELLVYRKLDDVLALTAGGGLKEGKGAIKMDPAVMPFLRRQRFAVSSGQEMGSDATDDDGRGAP